MTALSVIIPARNERFLKRTVEDVLTNMRADTEIIVILDGAWPLEPLAAHPRVTVIYLPESIGQRAAVNLGARVSNAKYIMKLDAHCALAPGFDVTLMETAQPEWIQVPRMYNLHAFDFVCQGCGARKYQGGLPPACEQCGGANWQEEIVWHPRLRQRTDYMWFDTDLIFRYFDNLALAPYGKDKEKYHHGLRAWAKEDVTDLMTCLGACWFVAREHFWELGGLDEQHGSWGQMGTEIAGMAWLSGGALKVNKKTWFAHLFRSSPGFSFPYPLSHQAQERAREYSRDKWLNNRWDKAVRPLSWLIEKFQPLPGWDKEKRFQGKPFSGETKKAIIYYTDNRLEDSIFTACQRQIQQAINGHELISVSLQPLDFGRNLILDKPRGYLTLFEQILAGLEASPAEIVYLCEHDVLYTKEHFDFIPPDPAKIYYNQNVWQVRISDGYAVTYEAKRLSQLVAYREVLLAHYQKRVANTRAKLEEYGDTAEYRRFIRQQGFEPGSHGRAARVDDLESESFVTPIPNLDLKHGQNLTAARWSPDQFRDQRNCQNWQVRDVVPGWGSLADLVHKLKAGQTWL